jgi:hypothetical protein
MGRKGQTGTPMTTFRVTRAACKHDWTPLRRSGLLDKTERRDWPEVREDSDPAAENLNLGGG